MPVLMKLKPSQYYLNETRIQCVSGKIISIRNDYRHPLFNVVFLFEMKSTGANSLNNIQIAIEIQ